MAPQPLRHPRRAKTRGRMASEEQKVSVVTPGWNRNVSVSSQRPLLPPVQSWKHRALGMQRAHTHTPLDTLPSCLSALMVNFPLKGPTWSFHTTRETQTQLLAAASLQTLGSKSCRWRSSWNKIGLEEQNKNAASILGSSACPSHHPAESDGQRDVGGQHLC